MLLARHDAGGTTWAAPFPGAVFDGVGVYAAAELARCTRPAGAALPHLPMSFVAAVALVVVAWRRQRTAASLSPPSV
jgi:hypothetical protein